MVQRDLGQPRPKLAGAGDKQAEHTFGAQGGRKILRLTEYRGNAAGHLLPGAFAVEPRLPGVIGTRLFIFGRNVQGGIEML